MQISSVVSPLIGEWSETPAVIQIFISKTIDSVNSKFYKTGVFKIITTIVEFDISSILLVVSYPDIFVT